MKIKHAFDSAHTIGIFISFLPTTAQKNRIKYIIHYKHFRGIKSKVPGTINFIHEKKESNNIKKVKKTKGN